MSRAHSTAIAALAAASALLLPPAANARPLHRPADPVVLEGASVPPLLGLRPERIVAYRWSRGRWSQIPVQVDERRTADLGEVYANTRRGIEIEAYADPSTLTGADPDPALDADDEIATMARFAGGRAKPARRGKLRRPPEVRRGRAVEVRLRDRGRGVRRWIYLFRGKPGLDPAAGRDLVSYRFRLPGGAYPDDFDFRDGPNPERSAIATRHYRLRFVERWINDLLEIRAGGAASVDLLDRRKVQFAPGFCGRSTDTFADAEGAFVTNVDGPIRAIRSYVGANSGPMTQREHLFYERHEEVDTFLRVHSIPGVMDFFDYVPTPEPMRYRASTFAGSVPIDGSPDRLPTDPPRWEQISGPHGTLTHVARVETTVEGLELSGYQLDQANPNADEEEQCTGDRLAWGASGLRIDGGIPNTDPTFRDDAEQLTGRRTIYYDPPDRPRRSAVKRARWTDEPLAIRAERIALGRAG